MNQDDITSTTGTGKSATGDGGRNGGLVISTTETIRSFLRTASENPNLSGDLRDLASSLTQQSSIPYKSLKLIWIKIDTKTRPNILSLFTGSNFVFTSPKPREKSEELQARLKKLAAAAEEKAYEELVKDITPRKTVEEPFSSYKDQIGFGLHVVLIMFTGYLVGYFAFRALFGHSPVMAAAGGILGLVFGMLVETLLFIIRTSQDRQSSSSTPRIKNDQYFPSKIKKGSIDIHLKGILASAIIGVCLCRRVCRILILQPPRWYHGLVLIKLSNYAVLSVISTCRGEVITS